MKHLAPLVFAASAIWLCAAPAHAQKADAATPAITNLWVKPMVPGATVSAAYMHIKSASAIKLVKAESPVAGIVELHNMTMKGGVMEMKAVDAIDVPANKAVELKPGGLHVMLMMVKQPIKAGDKVPLTLTFEGADKKPQVVKLDAVAQDKPAQAHAH